MSVFFVGHPKDHDLALFAGGELGPLARWRIEKHLQHCGHCEQAVADFFHLQGELGDLAELPAVDWNEQASRILQRAAQQPAQAAPAGVRGIFAHPWALRTGLAAAAVVCAVVVVQQGSWRQDVATGRSGVMVAENAANRQEADALREAPTDMAERSEQTSQSATSPVSPPSRRALAPGEPQAKLSARSVSVDDARSNEQVAGGPPGTPVAPDIAAPAGPATPGAGESAGTDREVYALQPGETAGDIGSRAATTAQSAAVPEEAVALGGQAGVFADRIAPRDAEIRANLETPSPVANAGTRADTAKVELARAAPRAVAAETEQLGFSRSSNELAQAAEGLPASGAGGLGNYRIVPVLAGSQTEMGVAGNGAVSFRTVDAATGTITITHVYAH